MSSNDFDPPVGVVETLEPGVRRILAPNPSPMTFRGTNTYLLGDEDVVVIDPGPAHTDHLQAILQALGPKERITHILVTHSHLDHSPLAKPLSEATNAPVLAFGDSKAGRSTLMQEMADQGLTGGGEGVDHDFAPDRLIADQQDFLVAGHKVTAIWTPGHFCNHLSFAVRDIVFTGDHIMQWASTMISPPDGDVTAFMNSAQKLLLRKNRIYYPGHGAPVLDPADRVKELITHRKNRELEILSALSGTPKSIPEITQIVYHDVNPALLPAASRNVFAHLIDLHGRELVATTSQLSQDAGFFSA